MKNYTIRVVDAKSRKCLYKETFQRDKQNEAMSHFMEYLEIDTDNGAVYLRFTLLGMMAIKDNNEAIEYFLIYED